MYFLIVFFFLACVGRCLSCQVYKRKIVGGGYVRISQVPYTVQLRYQGEHMCGATIISKKWAVTAAHCVEYPKDVKHHKILSGSSWRGFGTVHSVAKIIPHENYDPFHISNDYDIALIRVKKRFKIGTRSVNVAFLPEDGSTPPEGTKAKASGWGHFWVGFDWLSIFLKAVNIPIIDKKKCNEFYEAHDKNVTERMVCAGYKKGNKDACQGDSGGPLVSKRVLVGIVSWGHGCAKPKFPGVYTDVGYFRQWIRRKSRV